MAEKSQDMNQTSTGSLYSIFSPFIFLVGGKSKLTKNEDPESIIHEYG